MQLPGHLLSLLSPATRRRVLWLCAGLVLAATAAALALAPGIRDSKHEAATEDRARSQRLHDERIARVRREGEPQRGSAAALAQAGGPAEALRRRRALVGRLEGAVLRDAHARARSGEVAHPALRVDCERFPRSVGEPPPEDLVSQPTGRYECLAVTSVIEPSAISERGLIGYPFRARADFRTGGYAWCRISGRPGEGGLRGQPEVPVPRICGGT